MDAPIMHTLTSGHLLIACCALHVSRTTTALLGTHQCICPPLQYECYRGEQLFLFERPLYRAVRGQQAVLFRSDQGSVRLVLERNADQMSLVAHHIHMCFQARKSNESHLAHHPELQISVQTKQLAFSTSEGTQDICRKAQDNVANERLPRELYLGALLLNLLMNDHFKYAQDAKVAATHEADKCWHYSF